MLEMHVERQGRADGFFDALVNGFYLFDIRSNGLNLQISFVEKTYHVRLRHKAVREITEGGENGGESETPDVLRSGIIYKTDYGKTQNFKLPSGTLEIFEES